MADQVKKRFGAHQDHLGNTRQLIQTGLNELQNVLPESVVNLIRSIMARLEACISSRDGDTHY